MSPASKRAQRREKSAPSGIERLRRRLEARKAVDVEAMSAEIAAQVIERRRAWDLSQKELAELCGTTQSAIARIERGRRPPRIDTLQRVANALDSDLAVELRPRSEEAKPG
jgi:ribosome-binding protein aMBF1 (putative translation factor)